ncbi:MAG: hypothetical protein PHX21_12790 [bacterium]|nr:hypothetical protein [bacterium]
MNILLLVILNLGIRPNDISYNNGMLKDSVWNPTLTIATPLNYHTGIFINACSTVSNNHNSALTGYCENFGTAGARGLLGVGKATGTGSSDGVCAFAYGTGIGENYGFRGSADNTSSGNAYGIYTNVTDNGTGYHFGGYLTSSANTANPSVGVSATAYNKGSGVVYGGSFTARDSGTGIPYGVYAESDSYAVYGASRSDNYAGYFVGNVTVTKGTTIGTFLELGRSPLSLVNGDNDTIIPTSSYLVVSGPTAPFSINGIKPFGTNNGTVLTIRNNTDQNMTLSNLSVRCDASFRINTQSVDVTTTGSGTAILVYDASSGIWELFSFVP